MDTLAKYIPVRELALSEAQQILTEIHKQVTKLLGKKMGRMMRRFDQQDEFFELEEEPKALRYILTKSSGTIIYSFCTWLEVVFGSSPPACYVTVTMDGPSPGTLLQHMKLATRRENLQELWLGDSVPRVALATFPVSDNLDVELIAQELASAAEPICKYLSDYDRRCR
jgi:hypothetical protein